MLTELFMALLALTASLATRPWRLLAAVKGPDGEPQSTSRASTKVPSEAIPLVLSATLPLNVTAAPPEALRAVLARRMSVTARLAWPPATEIPPQPPEEMSVAVPSPLRSPPAVSSLKVVNTVGACVVPEATRLPLTER